MYGYIPDAGNFGTLEVFVKVNGSKSEGVKIQLGDGCKLSDLLKKSTEKLHLTKRAKIAFYSNGLEVDDVDHIEEMETLHISLGEKFLPPVSETGESEVMAGWAILEKLGEGGFGSVRKARHTETGEVAAVKFMSKQNFKDFDDLQRVFMEIQVLRDLNHPNIIRIIDVHDHPENVCFFMEYASGGQLREYVEAKVRLTEEQARLFFSQIVKGIHYSHSKNVVHRDLKLENILLDEKENLKIVDFGMSDFVANAKKVETDAGTEVYLAPEVLSGSSVGSDVFKVDVWSLGVLLYILVCGRFPFARASSEVCRNLEKEGPAWPKDFELSTGLKNLVARMLTPDPSARISLNEISTDNWLFANRFVDASHRNSAVLATVEEETDVTPIRTSGRKSDGSPRRGISKVLNNESDGSPRRGSSKILNNERPVRPIIVQPPGGAGGSAKTPRAAKAKPGPASGKGKLLSAEEMRGSANPKSTRSEATPKSPRSPRPKRKT